MINNKYNVIVITRHRITWPIIIIRGVVIQIFTAVLKPRWGHKPYTTADLTYALQKTEMGAVRPVDATLGATYSGRRRRDRSHEEKNDL